MDASFKVPMTVDGILYCFHVAMTIDGVLDFCDRPDSFPQRIYLKDAVFLLFYKAILIPIVPPFSSGLEGSAPIFL